MALPVEFCLFALMLLGIALFQQRSLEISIAGLLLIVAYEALFSTFPTGSGANFSFKELNVLSVGDDGVPNLRPYPFDEGEVVSDTWRNLR